MKSDALTVAAIIFFVGIIISGVNAADFFSSNKKDQKLSELQRGVKLK